MPNDIFSNLDKLPEGNVQTIADRLEARAGMAAFADMRNQYFDLMKLADNAEILELGAGTGIVGRAYATRAGFQGRYVVSDLSEAMLDYGRKKAKADGLSDRLEFQVVNAMTGEGLGERQFDSVIMHTILAHVPDPAAVLETATKAVRKGGVLAVFDGDQASAEIASGDQALDVEVVTSVRANVVAQPTVIRQVPKMASALGLSLFAFLPSILAEAGKSEYFISMAEALGNVLVAQGSLKKETAEKWLAALNAAIANDTFFGMIPFFAYLYRKN